MRHQILIFYDMISCGIQKIIWRRDWDSPQAIFAKFIKANKFGVFGCYNIG